MQQVIPKVFVIAESTICDTAQDFLTELNVPDWKTDEGSHAEYLIELAGKNCYKSFSTDLNKNLTRVNGRNNHDYIQQGLVETGHGSVFEHATVTFALVDVSRVLTHELVRHRAGTAFSQESGRYVRTDQLCMYIPPDISDNEDLLHAFMTTAEMIFEQYKVLEKVSGINDMKDFDKKKKLTSALRRLLPNGQANSIIFTANHRTLRQIIEARTSVHAEEEIRVVFAEIFNLLKDKYVAIYADAEAVPHPEPGRAPEICFKHSKI
jgi:thymidylate synthase (FAD)